MPNLYCIPGLGTDFRIFEPLKAALSDEWIVETIGFIEPIDRTESVESYVKRWLETYSIKENSYLLGMSLGGMLAVEMCKTLRYKHFFLVSSLRHPEEVPSLFKIVRKIPAYRLVPAWWTRFAWGRLTKLAKITDDEGQKVLRDMINDRSALHLNWGRHTAVHWEPDWIPEKVTRIHGNKDHIFKYLNVKGIDYTIEGGTHNMIFDKAEQIAQIILNETKSLEHDV